MILVDTSVWIAVFRRRDPLDLEALVRMDEVVTCLPVIQEVLQGFGDERAHRLARTAMRAFPIVDSPMEEGVFLEAADLYRTLRRSGRTVRSSIDCLIATSAMRHDLEVLHVDRDFSLIAEVAPLRERRVPGRR